MKRITAVDIGASSIKAISGSVSGESISAEQVIYIPYRSFIYKENTLKEYSFNDFYFESRDALKNALNKLNDRIPADSFAAFTFNSVFTSVYSKKIKAKNKRAIRYAADILLNKIDDDNSNTDYQTICFDKSLQEAEIMLYSYKFQPFGELKEAVKTFEGKEVFTEFDSLALLNFYEYRNLLSEENIILDIGESKTVLMYLENKRLRNAETLNLNCRNMFASISNRLNVSIYDTEMDLQKNRDLMKISKGIITDNLSRFAVQISEMLKKQEYFSEEKDIFVSGGLLNNDLFFEMLKENLPAIKRIYLPEAKLAYNNRKYGFLTCMGLFFELKERI
ncbi:MAG: hypothetical protein CSB55_06370 [Candidatus Cloacimonadota bacterium]|nr:MAG: hypothetical protein CSB55_06370 [Candidatus Cloacimonadota bacterium]